MSWTEQISKRPRILNQWDRKNTAKINSKLLLNVEHPVKIFGHRDARGIDCKLSISKS